MNKKMYVDVTEVCEDWGVSRAQGYKIIKQLNDRMLSINPNNKEKEKTRLESKSKQEFWPGINPKYAVYKRQFVGNHVCPICNANLENKKIEDKSDECFFCHSKIVYDSSMTPLIESINNELAELTEKRKRIEKQIADYEIELSDYDSDFRSIAMHWCCWI